MTTSFPVAPLCSQFYSNPFAQEASIMTVRFLMTLCAITTYSLLSNQAIAQELVVDRVEEDWVIYIANPDQEIGAPQITNVIAPVPSTDGAFGMLELNHGSQPNFKNGGLQIQSWVGDRNIAYQSSLKTGRLDRDYDKVEYTVAMQVAGDAVRFSVKAGRSKSWGQFARDGLFADAEMKDANLSNYDPQFSVDNTTINVGAHRVAVMAQIQTRYFSGDQLVKKDETPRVLHRFQQLIEFVSLEEYELKEEYFNIDITE
jgi:hypothetical protein